MERIVSATEARIRFGEMMRRVVENRERVIVERGGKPYVVLLSVDEYERLKAAQSRPAWQDVLNEIREARARLQAQLRGTPLPPPEEIIREMREERDVRLTGLP